MPTTRATTPARPRTATAKPLADPLAGYPDEVDAGDLFRHAPPAVLPKWLAAAQTLATLGREAGAPVADLVARQIADLGLSFRITGDSEERPWPLTPMPLIVGADEWATVERGLIQRANLIEHIAADIYGPQTLVAEGHLPAAAITGSRFFARNMVGLTPDRGHMLHVYAVDLARGPNGRWRVLADRLRLANGIGYALENRLALSRATGALLGEIQTRRLADFFVHLREGIGADCPRENPRIALLTPGRFNQSYPEQAHLARYLGFPLVEGRDLIVSDDRLFVRTIAGPKRIDGLWRWIDSNALDPLNFDSRSRLGVPDLFNAWTRGGLAVANWPGIEVLESPAFAAFLPRLCDVVLGEAPILPNIATWWCGQPREASDVADHIDDLVITPAFGRDAEAISGATAPASLPPEQRAALIAAMHRRPMDYCGQEIVHLSTTPALIGESFAPRAFTVRAFLARGADGAWHVMPGGFARLSASGEMSTTLIGEGDLSADLCIVETDAEKRLPPIRLTAPVAVRRQGGILASQAADNLFWFGRYVERAESTTRVLRSLLGSATADIYNANPEVQRVLLGLLVNLGALAPSLAAAPLPEACRAVLGDRNRPDSIAGLLATLRAVALLLRDRFAPDVWRMATHPAPELTGTRPGALLAAARLLVERFGALSGLAAENMLRGPAWHFLEIGRRLERALATCRILRHIRPAGATELSPETLGALLDLCDSQITYHSRYLATAAEGPVFDLLLLDPANPRALVFQLDSLVGHIAALPPLRDDLPPEEPLRRARALLAPLQATTVEDWDDARLATLQADLLALSEAISARYFLHLERTADIAQPSFLA